MTDHPAPRPSSDAAAPAPVAGVWAADLLLVLASVGGMIGALVLSGFIFLTAAFSDSANGLSGQFGWFLVAWLVGIALPVACLVVGARGMRRRPPGAARAWSVTSLVVGVATTAVGVLVVGGLTLILLPAAFAPA